MLNALSTPSTATGLPTNLLPNLAAEAPGQRAANEAHQGFAALMQQQADLRSADLKSAEMKLTDASVGRARADDSRPPEAAPTRPATVATETRAPRQAPAKASATPPSTPPAKANEGSASRPAERAERSKNTRPESSSPAGQSAQDDTDAASDVVATAAVVVAAAAVAAGAGPGRADNPAALTEATVDQALAAAAAASTRQPTAPLDSRGPGRPGAKVGEDRLIQRLPRTAATEAAAAAAKLAAALSPKLVAEATEPLAQDAQPLDVEVADPAVADAANLNPEPAPLQPWLQAQAMVTHWRPVGDDTTPSADADPLALSNQAPDAPDSAAPLAGVAALQSRRPALAAPPDLRATSAAAPALTTPATDAPSDPSTDEALTTTGPTPQGGPRTVAEEARRANPLRTADTPRIGQRANWRPEPEHTDADRSTAALADASDIGPQTPATTDASALPPPALANQPVQAVANPPLPVASDARPAAAAAPTPATAAQLAVASGAAVATRGPNDPATPGARSAGERPPTGRAERSALTQDAARPEGTRATGAESAGSARTPAEALADRSSAAPVTDTRADATVPANPKALDATLPNVGMPTRTSEGALPAAVGGRAPVAHTEASGRLEPARAEALQAPAANGPAPGSLAQAMVGAAATPVSTTFAPLLSAATASSQAEARIAVPLNSPEFAPALGAQISVFTRDGVQTARLQLNPAEMGPITVQIALDGSAARVDFQADVAATRAVIEASLPALAGALQDAGLTLAGGGVFQHSPGQQQPQPEGQASQLGRGTGQGDSTRTGQLAEPAAPVVTSSRGLVDLVA